MKTASAQLITLLSTEPNLLMADLLTITLFGGTIIRLTSADIDITFGGNTFQSRSIQFERSAVKSSVGVTVDSLSLTLYGDATTLVNNQPLMKSATDGAFDGATIKLERAFMQTWGVVVGTLFQFIGRVAQIEIGRSEVRAQVNSNLELLNIQMPRNTYQPGCINTLYDTACALARTAVTSSTLSGSTRQAINCGLANAAGFFDLGYVTYTSGANAGVRKTVKTYVPGQLTLMSPLPNLPAVADTFNAFAGCNKTQATCTALGNLPRFRGMPYIPASDLLT